MPRVNPAEPVQTSDTSAAKPSADTAPADTPPGPWAVVTPVLLLSLAGLAALLAVAWWALDPTPQRRLVIATGPEQGAYAEFAKAYVPLLRSHGLTVELRATQGSSENLALLRQPRGEVHAAFVQGGAGDGDGGANDAPAPLSLGSIAVEPLWLFYRVERLRPTPSPSSSSSGTPAPAPTATPTPAASRPAGAAWPVVPAAAAAAAAATVTAPTRLAELAGWRIHTGAPGGGTAQLMAQLAADGGLDAQSLVAGGSAEVGGVVDLVQGRVDALALVSAAEAPLVQYLLRTPGVRLFGFAQAEAYARRHANLQPLVLPRGVVDLAADEPPQDVALLGTTASLAVRADLHPALRQLLLQTARDVHGGPGWFARPGQFPNAATDALALAPEAARFHRSGPPFLQRYLPFWAASFVDRMWIVLLPLLAALLPLSRIVPPLVTLRLRSRVYRWYAHLRRVEKALEQDEADLPRLRKELEHIDAQTERIRVPLAYAHELYDLRAHIHQVRKRLALRSEVAGEAAAGVGAGAGITALGAAHLPG